MKTVKIKGAGLAGLTSAICLKKYDPSLEIIVSEKNNHVGPSNNDIQQFENWVEERDVLEIIRGDTTINVEPAVIHKFNDMTVYSPKGKRFELKSDKPLFYNVRRGHREDSVDTYLKNLAIGRGVEILYKNRIGDEEADIIATGAKKIQGMACGYNFKTNLADGITGILDNNISPGGYAYLTVIEGEATLSSVLFRYFKNARQYREKTLERLKKLLGDFETENIKPFCGFDAYLHLKTRKKDDRLYVGSAGGFQDNLFGFGMRQAMISGSLAAKAICEDEDYDKLWKERFQSEHKNEINLRMIFDHMSNSGYEFIVTLLGLVQRAVDLNFKPLMHFAYTSPLVRILLPFAKVYFNNKYKIFTEL